MIRVLLCLLLLVMASSSTFAADILTDAGLPAARVMTDAEGHQVRGKGTNASVWGGSYARVGNNEAFNNYSAGANHNFRSSTAVGGSLSFAGKLNSNGNLQLGVAGGGAFAYAR